MCPDTNVAQGQPSEPVDAAPKVSVSSDRMVAEIDIAPPRNGGAGITEEGIRTGLAAARVEYGIDESLIEALVKSPQYSKSYVIARGTPAQDGKPAMLDYRVSFSRDMKPKENPDGTVDYKDLGFISNVREDDVLCVKTPATEGEQGSDVTGMALRPKPGKDVAMPMGKNTKLSEDELMLLASCDGQVDMIGQKLTVLNIFTVDSDVSNATGNISFVGSLVINGNILSGFTVQADGNITINGSVEDAMVIAGGNIIIKEGINGGGMGGDRSVQAGGYIKAKYIQDCNVIAGGEVETTFIQHSFIQCDSEVNVISAKGRLTGGRVVARNTINAVNAGGRTSVIPTILEVGNNPATVERHRQLENRTETLTNQRDSLLPAIHMLEALEAAGNLAEERLDALNQAREAHASIQANLSALEEEMAAVKAEMSTLGYGTVNIKQSAYPGVRIIIGPHQLLLETQYDHTSFARGVQGVSFGPYLE